MRIVGLRPKDRSKHGARTTVHAPQECGLGFPGGDLRFLQRFFRLQCRLEKPPSLTFLRLL